MLGAPLFAVMFTGERPAGVLREVWSWWSALRPLDGRERRTVLRAVRHGISVPPSLRPYAIWHARHVLRWRESRARWLLLCIFWLTLPVTVVLAIVAVTSGSAAAVAVVAAAVAVPGAILWATRARMARNAARTLAASRRLPGPGPTAAEVAARPVPAPRPRPAEPLIPFPVLADVEASAANADAGTFPALADPAAGTPAGAAAGAASSDGETAREDADRDVPEPVGAAVTAAAPNTGSGDAAPAASPEAAPPKTASSKTTSSKTTSSKTTSPKTASPQAGAETREGGGKAATAKPGAKNGGHKRSRPARPAKRTRSAA
ncbi:hypothetical protein D5H75_34960 [Bailinhaonella thermotolerans]|uniref:Uncharacterized protein n=2 Tax=Bailinhaonella thermotolerans TaxID=1070861 RepID=A0A3A4A6Y9_9ACTN|nr:hypothetical protein D5H75_34960 [Bailinhaonella thermotolerans]